MPLQLLPLAMIPALLGGGGEWQALVDRLAPSVGEVCAVTLQNVPNIHLARGTEFRQIAAEVAGRPYGRAARPGMFYDPLGRRIVVSDDLSWLQKGALNVRELSDLKRLRLFHELVHAWQVEELERLDMPLDWRDMDLATIAVLEGHSEWCTRKFVAKEGLVELYRRGINRLEQASRRAAFAGGPDLYFRYVESEQFWTFLEEQGAAPTLQTVLLQKRPTQRQIVFPREYVDAIDPPDLDFAFVAALVRDNRVTEAHGDSMVSPIGLVAFRGWLRGLGLPEERVNGVLAGYRGGVRTSGGRQLTVVGFDDEQAAACVFERAVEREQRPPRSRVGTTGEFVAGGAYFAYSAEARNGRRPCALIARDGRYVLEVIQEFGENEATEVETWPLELEREYRAARGGQQ